MRAIWCVMVEKTLLSCGIMMLLSACLHSPVEVRDDPIGPTWPYTWYWKAKKDGNGIVNSSVEAITFSGRDFVTVRHHHVPLDEPLPTDVVALAEKYCARLDKYAIPRDISHRYSNSAAFLCLTQDELDNFEPLKVN
ncbi:hypothetical protein [Thalassospira lucentensis]|uniref:Uncharacterized protein n=1 Tax=Thalassospira lucentensis TaxID=168935 RepID=A0A358HV86_9PROT|nr:hypothetical protein [Thalassospira lucentensis]HBU99105.1 hypothetical protein [Thalassospira lucentensis]HCW68786.1 hypothetical protein [Thalassospira lucentensis]